MPAKSKKPKVDDDPAWLKTAKDTSLPVGVRIDVSYNILFDAFVSV